MKIFDKTYDVLERKLDLYARRHEVLAGNVANNETPNFRARELNFAGELEKALSGSEGVLKRTDAQHLDVSGSEGAHVVFDNSGAVGADGNNVDLDISMGKLMANSRTYGETVDILSSKLQILKLVLGSRGGS